MFAIQPTKRRHFLKKINYCTSSSLVFLFSNIIFIYNSQLTGSQESMLRVEEEDPFNILYYDSVAPPSPSTVLVSSGLKITKT